MKSAFATTWKRSAQPRKQRKYVHNAPAHVKGKFLSAHLDKPLREKYGKRSLRVRKGDKVKILRGNHKGKEGAVERIDAKRTLVYVTKVEHAKTDGTKAAVALHPSSLLITEPVLEDKKRKARLQQNKKGEKAQ